jgi:hypothetical protein
MPTIAELLASGRLEQLPPDEHEAGDLLHHAEAHLESAARVGASDPTGAYQLAYDAARKAVAADMAASGYRAKAASLSRLDGMRRLRNRAEYGGMTIGATQLAADLEHAREVVRAVGVRLGRS